MTTEPMSDERFVELCDAETICVEGYNELARELQRLRDIPPDVLAAMERYRAKPPLLSSDEWWQERRAAGELIARHFTSHHGKDGA